METESNAIIRSWIAVPPLLWAALGVLTFSFTFPATVLAERGFDPYVVGAGRSVIAALIAAGCLLSVRAPLPRRADLPGRSPSRWAAGSGSACCRRWRCATPPPPMLR